MPSNYHWDEEVEEQYKAQSFLMHGGNYSQITPFDLREIPEYHKAINSIASKFIKM
jgi:hypothetical protein